MLWEENLMGKFLFGPLVWRQHLSWWWRRHGSWWLCGEQCVRTTCSFFSGIRSGELRIITFIWLFPSHVFSPWCQFSYIIICILCSLKSPWKCPQNPDQRMSRVIPSPVQVSIKISLHHDDGDPSAYLLLHTANIYWESLVIGAVGFYRSRL